MNFWFSVHGRGIRSNYIMHHQKGTSQLFIDPIKGFSNVNKDTCMYHGKDCQYSLQAQVFEKQVTDLIISK